MNNDKIEISQNGSLLLYKTGYNPEFVRRVIEDERLKGLRVWTDPLETPPVSLTFLRHYTFLKHLDVTSVYDYGFEFLASLTHLQKLSIHVEGEREIDLAGQANLEYLALQWRKGKVKHIENCKRLDFLCLIGFNETDFTLIGALNQLKTLMVKTASVKNVSGLQELKKLESMLLGNCRSLVSVGSLNGLTKLRCLEFEACSKVQDFNNLKNLPGLEYLRLTDCKEIESIKFVRNFPLLSRLVLNGNTKVTDGDLEPLRVVNDQQLGG